MLLKKINIVQMQSPALDLGIKIYLCPQTLFKIKNLSSCFINQFPRFSSVGPQIKHLFPKKNV